MPFRDQSFVVVDTETTGTDPAEDRIIEIGAVRIEGGEIVDRFEQLVDPGRPVPRSITRLTGISTPMVSDQPGVRVALKSFLDFAGDSPLVAHNAGFDHRFLALEALRVEVEGFQAPFLCTLRLARRLLPGLPSKGLDSLKKFYGLSIARRHRAMDDAELTGQVLLRLLPHAQTAGARDIAGLRHLQAGRYASTGATSKRLEWLKTERVKLAPREPGVYRFVDTRGRLLYVGKAHSLYDRLRQYVVAVEAHPPRTRRLMARVRDVSWQVFSTEVEAMIVESRTIKQEQPPHNRALRKYRKRPFLLLHEGSIELRTVIQRDGARHFGPMPDSRTAKVVAEILEACCGVRYGNRPSVRTPLDRERYQHVMRAAGWLREASGPGRTKAGADRTKAVADRTKAVAGRTKAVAGRTKAGGASADSFLAGDVSMVLERLSSAMEAASAAFDFEAAAMLRDWIGLVRDRSARPGGLTPQVFDRDALLEVSIPGRQREMVILRDGLPVGFGSERDDFEGLWGQVARWTTPEYLDRTNAEDANVVAHWSHRHREYLRSVTRQVEEPFETFLSRAQGYFTRTSDRVSV